MNFPQNADKLVSSIDREGFRPLETYLHDTKNSLHVLESYLELDEDHELLDRERFKSFRENPEKIEEFVENYYQVCSELERFSADKESRETMEELAEDLEGVAYRKARDIALTTSGTIGLLEHAKNGYRTEDTIELGRVLEPVKTVENASINYGDIGSDFELNGNDGLMLPVHTIAPLNFEDHVQRKYEDARLNVRTEKDEDYVSVFFTDDGDGVETYEGLFDQDEDKSGYGLPMASRVLESYGGGIEPFEPEERSEEDLDGFGVEIKLPYSSTEESA